MPPTHPSPSRANALKHGLTGAGHVLPPDFDAPLATSISHWSEALNPQSPTEHFLVRRIAIAAIRMEHCSHVTAHLDHAHKNKSPEMHDLDRQFELQKLSARFDKDPAFTRLLLMRTPEGTKDLIRRWRRP